MSDKYQVVPEGKTFTFKNLCPYCNANLTYSVDGWIEDTNDLYLAHNIVCECDNEPDIDNPEWHKWWNTHQHHPYIHQLPIDLQVKDYINNKYRFKLNEY